VESRWRKRREYCGPNTESQPVPEKRDSRAKKTTGKRKVPHFRIRKKGQATTRNSISAERQVEKKVSPASRCAQTKKHKGGLGARGTKDSTIRGMPVQGRGLKKTERKRKDKVRKKTQDKGWHSGSGGSYNGTQEGSETAVGKRRKSHGPGIRSEMRGQRNLITIGQKLHENCATRKKPGVVKELLRLKKKQKER